MRKLLIAAALLLPVGCQTPKTPASDGWSRLELGDAPGALRAFERDLAEAKDAVSLAGRARALYLLGRIAEAEASYALALAQDPAEPQWHLGASLVHLANGNTQGAIAACNAALNLDPQLAKAYFNRGYAQDLAGQSEAAVADYSLAITHDPTLAQAYNSRGIVLARGGRHAEALRDFQVACHLQPLPAAHANSAASLYALGNVERALAELNTAIKLERGRPQPLIQRGQVYLDLGQFELAERDLSEALALNPGNHECARLLASARTQDHDRRPNGRVRRIED